MFKSAKCLTSTIFGPKVMSLSRSSPQRHADLDRDVSPWPRLTCRWLSEPGRQCTASCNIAKHSHRYPDYRSLVEGWEFHDFFGPDSPGCGLWPLFPPQYQSQRCHCSGIESREWARWEICSSLIKILNHLFWPMFSDSPSFLYQQALGKGAHYCPSYSVWSLNHLPALYTNPHWWKGSRWWTKSTK